MYHLIYVSQAVQPMTETELAGILEKSRDYNRRDGITGLLIYKLAPSSNRANFMQLLEGDSEILRREQVEELRTRKASAELTRGMHLALGVREIDLRRTSVIGASGKAVERLNGTVRGTAAATSPNAKSPPKRLGWETLIA